jgi:hypothetical protein
MLKKTLGFGFVAGTALFAVALSGGCSSTTTTNNTDPVGDATPDVKKVGDGGGNQTDGDVVGNCPGDAPAKADLPAWKPPPAKQDVCTAADITKFESNFKGAKLFSDLIVGIPTACGACIMGKEDDATWPLVVTDDKGELGFMNFGACYARATNGSDACGEALQLNQFCLNAACSDCADSEQQACEDDDATGQACAANFGADIKAGCGTDSAKLKTLDAQCGKATLAVGVLCGGGGVVDSGAGG